MTVSASATRLVALEVRGGVRPRGRADVAALAVGDHEQPGAARVGADLVERGHPLGAERLEERELRLDRDRVRRDRVDDPAAEARDVAAQLDRQQVGQRVEPDDELAPLPLDLGREPVGERERGDGHPAQLRGRIASPAPTERGSTTSRGPHSGGPGPRAASNVCPSRRQLGRQPPLTAALSWLPALNFGTVVAAICDPLAGARVDALRAARSRRRELPEAVKLTESPAFSASVTDSRNASTALPASRFVRPLFSATL